VAIFLNFSRRISSAGHVCLASGVLYHNAKSAELIGLMAARCSGHINHVDATLRRAVRETRSSSACFRRHTMRTSGFKHRLFKHEYGRPARVTSFCGGRNRSVTDAAARTSSCLKHFGFGTIRIAMRSSTRNRCLESLWSLRGRSSWQIDHRHVAPDSRIRASTARAAPREGSRGEARASRKACPHATAPSERARRVMSRVASPTRSEVRQHG